MLIAYFIAVRLTLRRVAARLARVRPVWLRDHLRLAAQSQAHQLDPQQRQADGEVRGEVRADVGDLLDRDVRGDVDRIDPRVRRDLAELDRRQRVDVEVVGVRNPGDRDRADRAERAGKRRA